MVAGLFALGVLLGAAMSQLTGVSVGGLAAENPLASVGIPGQRGAYPADVVRVLDGDTFEARVHVWPGIEITTKVRLRGIDAPELNKPRCAQERQKAVAARDALQAILDQGGVGISAVALDKYGGRVVADASTRATSDVSAALLDAGHVRGYSGGRRDSWC